MSTITVKQFFRNVFYIMLTLAATPYMLLSTFLSLFMDVPVLTLSMEVYLPGYDLTPKYQEEEEQDQEEDEQDQEEEEDEQDQEEDESDSEPVKVVHTIPVLAPINSDSHHDNLNSDNHCTPIPRHNSEASPESPLKRRPTDIDSTEDFNNITSVDLPTIHTPPPSVDSENVEEIKQEPSESSSSAENDE